MTRPDIEEITQTVETFGQVSSATLKQLITYVKELEAKNAEQLKRIIALEDDVYAEED